LSWTKPRSSSIADTSAANVASRPHGELADHDRDGEVDGERHPVLGLPQTQRVHRLEEEEVEGEHARDRHEERRPETENHRRRHHGQQVKDTEAQHRRHLPEPEDHSGDGDDEQPTENEPGRRPRRRASGRGR
jgi:hypothetical protein